jgi:RND family efflux transporter MFP subunit
VARADEVAAKVHSIPVRFIHPKKGGLERLSTQPGSIQAYESVNLYAKVPGFLKVQNVDIGSRVKKGDLLAKVDVPELEAQAERTREAINQARAKVSQMKARLKSAEADRDAADSAVIQANATAKSDAAWLRYRKLQLGRMDLLFKSRSIEEKLVDEYMEHHEAAVEKELSAKAAIVTTKAKVIAAEAKIESAKADIAEAEAEVRLTQAELRKVAVQISFGTITAPFDGVVVARNLFVGDFVRSANEGGGHEPLLTIHRTDKMRVVVQIPDRDVPFADIGDTAIVEIDALPQNKLTARIARIAQSEDPQTRLMRVELDLPNPTGKIFHGMYGKVTIVLDKAIDQLSIPSSCLVGKSQDGIGAVYTIRDHHAHLTQVRLGVDNGIRVAVLAGLKAQDEVVQQPGSDLAEDAVVNPSESGIAKLNH